MCPVPSDTEHGQAPCPGNDVICLHQTADQGGTREQGAGMEARLVRDRDDHGGQGLTPNGHGHSGGYVARTSALPCNLGTII